MPYKDTIIYQSGGDGDAMIAFKQSDGSVAWKGLKFKNSHVSPILIQVDGQTQGVGVGANSVFGFNPDNGALLWAHPHVTNYGLAISTPIWAPAAGNVLFVASACTSVLFFARGGRALRSAAWAIAIATAAAAIMSVVVYYAWFIDNAGGQTHPVAQKPSNPWGLYDMIGNVWQWCDDWYAPYPGGSVTDPHATDSSLGIRVLRGGSWNDDARACRSAYRSADSPDSGFSFYGFRVVLVLAD